MGQVVIILHGTDDAVAALVEALDAAREALAELRGESVGIERCKFFTCPTCQQRLLPTPGQQGCPFCALQRQVRP